MPGVPPAQYGYFGPAGTFTHQALLTLPAQRGEALPYPTVGQALQAVHDGEVTKGQVLLESGRPREALEALRRAGGVFCSV